MLKNKKIARIFKVIVGCMTIMVSPYVCANTIHVPVEIGCSNNLLESPWITFNGIPGVRYTLTTRGLRDSEANEDVVKVVNAGLVSKTIYGLHVHVEARCIPRNNGKYVSITGTVLGCGIGEGIKINMFAPNSSDSNRYRYVGMLTISQDEKKEYKGNIIFNGKEELSQVKIKLDIPEVEPRSYNFINSFSQ